MRDLEHQDQVALFRWAAWNFKKYPELEWMYAVPNAGKRSPRLGAYMKAEGLKAGVPDIVLPAARGGYHGLYIEMKIKPNRPTKKQLDWHTALREQGYRVEVCYGWEEGAAVLESYLNG